VTDVYSDDDLEMTEAEAAIAQLEAAVRRRMEASGEATYLPDGSLSEAYWDALEEASEVMFG
jgi:hypothetical protein